MALGFSTYQRLERLTLKTRNVLGEGDPTFKEENKIQALQEAADFYNLYGGNGSETTYTDLAGLTIKQSAMIATKAAISITISAISYYKDDVVQASAGPASASFRGDKLAWLKTLIEELEKILDELEDNNGIVDPDALLAMEGLLLDKGLACADPPGTTCADICSDSYFVDKG